MIELVVAATLLVTVLSVATNLTVRSGRLWQDSRHYRLALDELTNQLERLTALPSDQRSEALTQLAPSAELAAALPHPEFTADTLDDELGTRLILRLNWDRQGKSKPVTLVGWIASLPTDATPSTGDASP